MSSFLRDYIDQVRLLLRVLPHLDRIPDFAMKGGTAINLFLRPLPRLSVDIDLVYLPIEDRPASLKKIEANLGLLKQSVEKEVGIKSCRLEVKPEYSKLYIEDQSSIIKVEPNSLLRGTIFSCAKVNTHPFVKKEFGFEAKVNLIDSREIYAGKFCAAIDRQHPRDFFDVREIMKEITKTELEEFRSPFCVYMAMTGRPIHELLNSKLVPNFEKTFKSSFDGMTNEAVSAKELIVSFDQFKKSSLFSFTKGEKEFLIKMQIGEVVPEGLKLSESQKKKIPSLPGIKWKILNVEKLKNIDSNKYRQAINQLETELA